MKVFRYDALAHLALPPAKLTGLARLRQELYGSTLLLFICGTFLVGLVVSAQTAWGLLTGHR